MAAKTETFTLGTNEHEAWVRCAAAAAALGLKLHDSTGEGFTAGNAGWGSFSIKVSLQPGSSKTSTSVTADLESFRLIPRTRKLSRFCELAAYPERAFDTPNYPIPPWPEEVVAKIAGDDSGIPSRAELRATRALERDERKERERMERERSAPRANLPERPRGATVGVPTGRPLPGLGGALGAMANDPSWQTARQVTRAYWANGWTGVYGIYRVNRLAPMSNTELRIGWLQNIIDHARIDATARKEVQDDLNRTRADAFHHR